LSDSFFERGGCPFCGQASGHVLAKISYHETAEANRELPALDGRLELCPSCGVAYSSHGCRIEAFASFYRKTLTDLDYLDRSLLQRVRRAALRRILSEYHRPWSVSRLLDALSLHILHIPPLGRRPRGLRLLDVGSGLGEFLEIYRDLGNEVVGTEVIPELAARLRERGLDCHFGEVEALSLPSGRFDAIVLRAVFYRTRDPAGTLRLLKALLAPGGEIVLVDPCPLEEGVPYFARKHFPQGHFYICDPAKYLGMLRQRFGLSAPASRIIYGRPEALLRPARLVGNAMAFAELLAGNLMRRKPYFLSYRLEPM
jgi:SAM-dependent methyltransferase